MITDNSIILTQRRTQFRELAIHQLVPGPYQPRTTFSQTALESLAQTFRSVGIIEPLAVRVKPKEKHQYEIIAGERRWRAAQLAKLPTVPCLIGHYSDEAMAQASLVENIHREDLDPLAKARAIQRLIDEFNYTHDKVGTILGVNRATVTNQLRLLKLDARLQVWLSSGDLSEGHGKVLASLPLKKQYLLGHKSVRQDWSVHTLEKFLNEKRHVKETKKLEKASSKTFSIEQKIITKLKCPTKLQIKTDQSGSIRLDFKDHKHMKAILVKLGIKC